jgi:hypothetical protein
MNSLNFKHKIISFAYDIDNDGDESAFNTAVQKVLDTYDGEHKVDIQMSVYLNTRGTECRTVMFIITAKSRLLVNMDKMNKTVKGKKVEMEKYTLDSTIVEKVFEAIGLNFALDSRDEELLRDVEMFCVYTGMTIDLNGWDWDKVQEEWNDFQSK